MPKRRHSLSALLILATLYGCALSGPASAQSLPSSTGSVVIPGTNAALGKPVIGWSGFFDSRFVPSGVTDNHLASNPSGVGGTVMDGTAAPFGYWLGKNNDPAEFFVVDIGEQVYVDYFELFNTHNRTSNDRYTSGFEIWGSNAVAPLTPTGGASGMDLVSPTLLASGTLAFQSSASDPIDPEVYQALVDDLPFQYFRFNALNGGPNGVGLNEFRLIAGAEPPPVQEVVPEPASIAIWLVVLLAFGGFHAWRRRLT